MEQTDCFLPTFGELTEQQIAFINKNSSAVHHRTGEIIFMQERPVSQLIYVKSGLLKLYKEIGDGKDIILNIVSAEHFIGLASVFYSNIYPYSASSIEGGEIIYTSAFAIREVFAENGKYAMNLMTILSSQVVYLVERMITLSKKQIPGRIAETLLFFSRKIYNSPEFTLPLSRNEIASYVQTSKESVSRTLTEFRNDKIIELDDKKIVLKSLELLEILNKIG
jgi:CRP/FNR family transcriptional regulator, polysaccharide utilization system transcription regulator